MSMTLREANKMIRAGKYIIALYTHRGEEKQGRMIQVRTRKGALLNNVWDGKLLATGQWVPLKSWHDVWVA